MKVVLLGGSFNPIHFGHLKIMQQAVKVVNADEGWFVLANDPPLKDNEMLNFSIRSQFIKYMIKGFKNLKLCEIEKEMAKPNYTYHTIIELKKRFPKVKFYFLIGTDQASQFDKWYNYQELLKQIQLIVYPREGYQAPDDLSFVALNATTINVSSTEIRQNKSFLTHPKILSEIALYGYFANERLEQYLSKYRLQHTLRVAEVSVDLAKAHNLDVQLAYGIAIAHDLLKEFSDDDLKTYLSDKEMAQEKTLWHGFASAKYHSLHMYVKDKRFLNAIYHHTLGNSHDHYSQILYIADKCEPGRKNQESKLILDLAKKDLKSAFKLCKKRSYDYYERKTNESSR